MTEHNDTEPEGTEQYGLYLQSFASITDGDKLIGTYPTKEEAKNARDERLGGAMNRSKVDYTIKGTV